jgi:hypothetical protein
MGHAVHRASKEVPLERIFRKIVGRKMTLAEQIWFNVKPASRISQAPYQRPRKPKKAA